MKIKAFKNTKSVSLPSYQSEMFFFRLPVYNESEAIWNLNTQSEILCANLKPVWNQSEANLENAPIWNNIILIIWGNLKHTETILEA